MKILPMVSAGEVFLRDDGEIEILPMQVFRMKGGGLCIRLGRNVYAFNPSGGYDGSEHKAENVDAAAMVHALESTDQNHGRAPRAAYYPEGSANHAREIAGWPRVTDPTRH